MTPAQVEVAADLLVKKFYWFKIEDFQFCFEKILLGEYGVVEYFFDVTKLIDYCSKYAEQRSSSAENISIGAHKSSPKENVYDIFSSGPVYDSLKKVAEQIVQKIDEQPVVKKVNIEDNFSARVFRKIDEQFNRKVRINNIFVKTSDGCMDINDYLKFRTERVRMLLTDGYSLRKR